MLPYCIFRDGENTIPHYKTSLRQLLLLHKTSTEAHAMVASEPYDSFSHQVFLFPACGPLSLVATGHQWFDHLPERQA